MKEKDIKELEKMVKTMMTSKLIDKANTKNDKIAEIVLCELDDRFPFDWLNERIDTFEESDIEVRKRLKEVETRLNNLDSFWNIANKLNMILDRIPKRKGAYQRMDKKL